MGSKRTQFQPTAFGNDNKGANLGFEATLWSAADKGFYESMEKIKELEEEIEVVSIEKKGSRNQEEAAREKTKAFRLGQKFRAGVEGSISFLKRILGLWRCMNKGWEHYVCTVGTPVFVHNLLVLARA